ncbi:DUF349 domain-containing protein [Litoribrevibacter albus]|uniref:DUF349 domain-containing protein n=1 Tax=Litoribrevibacter albus TaxID=1473156 RepID=A0AA37S8Y5_9GAMM|nr:DUF349 domain-containing protein [Litoribrevibacter albus]GLQ31320.1 hypothetical protein GCM10007876_17990 [Litoribrevibacter albus]
MANFFKQIFKPKWQHKSEDVRATAVSQLSDQNPEQKDILIQVLTNDTSDKVKQTAILQISQLDHLIELSHSNNKSIQSLAQGRLSDTLSIENKQNWPKDPQQIRDLVISLPNLPTISELVSQITDQKQLAKIAEQARVAAVRQQATVEISDEAILEELEKAVKGKDKGCQKIIRDKLSSLNEARERQAMAEAEIIQTIQAAEQQAKLPYQPLCEAKLDTLQTRWNKIKADANSEYQAQFETALNQCKQIIAEHYHAESEKQAQVEAHKDAKEEQEATITLLESEQDGIIEQGDFNSPALNALLKTQANRWQDSCETTKPSKSLENRYARVCKSLEHFIQAKDTLEEKKEELQALLNSETPDLDALKSFLASLNWPSELKEPELLTQAHNALGDAQKEQRRVRSNLKQDCKQADELLSKAEEMLTEGTLKGIYHNLRQAQELMQSWPNERKINKRLRQLQYKFKEMKDWQDYAVLPKLEELCDRMESLVDADMPLETLSSQLKQARNDWRELGYGDNNYGQALWHRFKDASDKVNERCKPYFEAVGALREQNLELRKSIITQLTEFVEKVDWEKADWKVIDKLYKQSIEEWKQATPVDRAEVKKIQDSFDQPLHLLKDRIKAERDKNTQTKQDLLEQSKELLSLDNLKQATDKAKTLQKQWQEVGICHRRQEQHLWKEFREVCDELFGKRSDQWKEQQDQRETNLHQAAEIIDQIKQLAQSDVEEAKELAAKLRELQGNYGNLGSLPRDHYEALEERYREASDLVKERMSELKRAHKAKQGEALVEKLRIYQSISTKSLPEDEATQQWQALNIDDDKLGKVLESAWSALLSGKSSLQPTTEDKLRELCIRSEIIADKPSPDADQSLRMSLQVERLSRGMTSGENQKETTTSLLSEWLSLEVPSHNFDEYLNRLLVALEYK